MTQVTVKTTAFLHPFLLPAVRRGIQGFLASFRLPEADPCALPSADGRVAFGLGCPQNNRPNGPKGSGGGVRTLRPRKRAGEPPGPMPLGVHPDCTRAHWKTASRTPAHHYRPVGPSRLTPMQRRESISAPPLRPAGTRRSKEPDPSTKPSPLPADLATAFEEMVEGCCIDWPESLAVERVWAAIAELVAAALVVAGVVVLARWTVRP